ncbi:aromatic ring-hydroxylating dioxygenase subunit alpha [Rhodobacteraceae bacterium NNCM2]|nr:aromatic ring-hydroxylating dioxygenase subunit alpha [Coraliihabitans acroporae]
MLDRKGSAERALPARYYTDPSILAAEREAVFFRTWQMAGHVDQFANPGDFLTLAVLDQNIFVIRGKDNEIRAFYNVCPHRGHRLVEGAGTKSRITCLYHAWTYALDGRLVGQRREAETSAPDRGEISLSSVQVDTLAGFVFVNLDPGAPSIRDYAPGLEEQINQYCPEIGSYRLEESDALGNDYTCAANWKVMIDNYLECHHCGPAHHSFNDMMNLARSEFHLFEHHTFQIAPTDMKAQNKAFPLHLDHDVTTGHFWFLFPNTVFGRFPGVPGFYVSRFDPVTPDLTTRTSLSLTVREPLDPEMPNRHRLRAEWSRDVVGAEDKALCENVQIGLHQRGFQQGWYVTDPHAHDLSEHAMRHFHGMYLEALEGLAKPWERRQTSRPNYTFKNCNSALY